MRGKAMFKMERMLMDQAKDSKEAGSFLRQLTRVENEAREKGYREGLIFVSSLALAELYGVTVERAKEWVRSRLP